MVFTNVFYQFLAVSKRRSEISVCFLDASFVDDFLFLELLVQCVSESLDGTLPHESVFHQCDKQSCYICFRSMGFQSCANSFMPPLTVVMTIAKEPLGNGPGLFRTMWKDL